MNTGNFRRVKIWGFASKIAALGILFLLGAAVDFAQPTRPATGRNQPVEMTHGTFEQVAEFKGAMPTGVTVSQSGRISSIIRDGKTRLNIRSLKSETGKRLSTRTRQ